MCHIVSLDASFWDSLVSIDEQLLEEARRKRCPHCTGPLHRADYPKKVKGNVGGSNPKAWEYRMSLCCGIEGCRKRLTPMSVRFFGRKGYAGAIVVLACVFRLLFGNARNCGVGKEVPRRTTNRWLQWWRDEFARSSFWQVARARFMPTLDDGLLPLSLLERFGQHTDGWQQALVAVLRFIAPMQRSDRDDREAVFGNFGHARDAI